MNRWVLVTAAFAACAIYSPQVDLFVDPGGIDFGVVDPNLAALEPPAVVFKVANIGTVENVLHGLSVQGDLASSFSVHTESALPMTLAPGEVIAFHALEKLRRPAHREVGAARAPHDDFVTALEQVLLALQKTPHAQEQPRGLLRTIPRFFPVTQGF